jgi:AcrR family transcriptional regulator
MQTPSLYSHFVSKNAIYDAMYAEAWAALATWLEARLSSRAAPRKALLIGAEAFFGFATADLARYQLMTQRTIPDFTPTTESYAYAIAVYEQMRVAMRGCGVTAAADLDLWTAFQAGLADQQLANDPGGTRWRRQLPRVVDMFADEVGIRGPSLRRKR